MTTEIDLYLQSREYVDTAIIPLVPVSFGDQMKNTVLQGEFITTLSNEIERQFKGRMFLLPPFTYWKNPSLEGDTERLLQLKHNLIEQGLNHVFFMTSDSTWRELEDIDSSSLIWLPAVPLEHVESKYKQQIITDQVQQVVPLILTAWRK
jgi:hypothetical protein